MQHGLQMYLDVLSPRALRRVSGAERTIDLPFRVNPSASWQFSLGRLRFSFETTPIWYQLHPIRGSASVFRAEALRFIASRATGASARGCGDPARRCLLLEHAQ
jgi:hypothetical protein